MCWVEHWRLYAASAERTLCAKKQAFDRPVGLSVLKAMCNKRMHSFVMTSQLVFFFVIKNFEAKTSRTRLTALDSDDEEGQDVKHFWNMSLGLVYFKFARRGLFLLTCKFAWLLSNWSIRWPLGIWATSTNADMGSSWYTLYLNNILFIYIYISRHLKFLKAV